MAEKPAPSAPKRAKRRKSRGALAAIGALLLASAVLRISIGASEAVARDDSAEDTAETAAPEVHDPYADPPPQVIDWHDGTRVIAEEEIVPLLKALNERQKQIHEMTIEMDVREKGLALAEERVLEQIERLEVAEQNLRDTMALAQTAAEDDLTQLTSVYANMKPKQAAALFEEMDPDFAAGFLGRMRPESAAEIMARMTPEAAYALSVIVAGRNAEVTVD